MSTLAKELTDLINIATRKELEEARLLIEFKLNKKGHTQFTKEEVDFWSDMNAALSSRGYDNRVTLDTFVVSGKQPYGLENYTRAVLNLNIVIDYSWSALGLPNAVERSAISKILLIPLINQLMSGHQSFSVKALLDNTHRIASVASNDYPGYLESKMLHVLVMGTKA